MTAEPGRPGENGVKRMTRELDGKKICFITAVNDEKKYQHCLASIGRLAVPAGMELEYQPMRGFSSMTAAYEAGRRASKAKYKVYLHQDVELLHKQLLEKLVEDFQSDPSCGILGVVGCADIPENGVWWDSTRLLGTIQDDHTGRMRSYRYQVNERKCVPAQGLDGLFLATQYDVPWRTDLFRQWHFYDLSQCMEFQRRGYKAAVAGQRMPWCRHFCGQNPLRGYDEARQLFLREYGQELMAPQARKPEGQSCTSIVILSCNTYGYTRACIESIRKYTAPGTYELIVVDNGSTDQSGEWLKQQRDIHCIFNKKNEGFPRGCNQGMQAAAGTELLLLNSDTVVTTRWLEQLKTALYSSEAIGAVGCVTNHAAGRQQIDTAYRNPSELQAFARRYNHTDPGKWEETLKLVGFCFLLKREIYDRLGGLDEQFSPGNFEDDDYSLRIWQAGYRLLLCRDTFIHHEGNASFLQSLAAGDRAKKIQRYNAMLDRNAALFEKKWQIPAGYGQLQVELLNTVLAAGVPDRILELDCGCGADLLCLRALRRDVQLKGITSSSHQAAVGSRVADVHCCEAMETGIFALLSGPYDAILVTDILPSMQNGEAFIYQLRKFLSPTGKLYFQLDGKVYVLDAA